MADENDNDEELIRQAVKGNDNAFAQLMRRYEARLFNIIFRSFGNKADAEDIVQETFINAYQSLGQYKPNSGFATWLYRVAYNAAISLKKTQQAGNPLAGPTIKIREGPVAALEADNTKEIDGHLIAEAFRGNDRAYGDLMARYREALAKIISELLNDPRERMTVQVQVFFAVRASLGQYRNDKPLVSWLYEIAKATVEEFQRNRDIPPA